MLQPILENLKSKNAETNTLAALQVLMTAATDANADFFADKANCFALLNQLFEIGSVIADEKMSAILEKITNKNIVSEFIQRTGISVNTDHPLYFIKIISLNDAQLLVNLLRRFSTASSLATYLTSPLDQNNPSMSRLEYLLSPAVPVEVMQDIFEQTQVYILTSLGWPSCLSDEAFLRIYQQLKTLLTDSVFLTALISKAAVINKLSLPLLFSQALSDTPVEHQCYPFLAESALVNADIKVIIEALVARFIRGAGSSEGNILLANALLSRWIHISQTTRANYWDRFTDDQKIQLLQVATARDDSSAFSAIWPTLTGGLRSRILTDANCAAIRTHRRVTDELVKTVQAACEKWDFNLIAVLHQQLGESLGPIIARAVPQTMPVFEERFVQTLCRAVAAPFNIDNKNALKYLFKWALDNGYYQYSVNIKLEKVVRVCLRDILPDFQHHQALFDEVVAESVTTMAGITDCEILQPLVKQYRSYFWLFHPALFLKITELNDTESMERIITWRYSDTVVAAYLNERQDIPPTTQQTRLEYLLLHKPALAVPLFHHRPAVVLDLIKNSPKLIAALRAAVGDDLYIEAIRGAVEKNLALRPQLAAMIAELTSHHPQFEAIIKLGLEYVVNGTPMLSNMVTAFTRDPASPVKYPALAKAIWKAVCTEATANRGATPKPETTPTFKAMELCYLQSLRVDELMATYMDAPGSQFMTRDKSLRFDHIFRYFLEKHAKAASAGVGSDEWQRYEERLNNYVLVHQFIQAHKDEDDLCAQLQSYIAAMPKPSHRTILFFPASNDTYHGLRESLTLIPREILIRRCQEMEERILFEAGKVVVLHPIRELANKLRPAAPVAVVDAPPQLVS